jgi:2-polyprenyl-6-hydroxyphenyl methylase/3-demethylubiquinone-9 3-methyltransferase
VERKDKSINNAFYDHLHEKWHEAEDHPIALLRAENALRAPWLMEKVRTYRREKCHILDIGCGAGLLSNPLAEEGHSVVGIDLSSTSLEQAKKQDRTGTVHYLQAAAESLPFAAETFDVVVAMDLLEHVPDPQKVIQEASRVLKPEGLFFFHTFNRNFLSWLLVIKAVEWFVPNTPPRIHVWDFFITPDELQHFCTLHQIAVQEWRGLRPAFYSWGFWKSFFLRRVAQEFRFTFSPSLKTGYVGFGIKRHF